MAIFDTRAARSKAMWVGLEARRSTVTRSSARLTMRPPNGALVIFAIKTKISSIGHYADVLALASA